MTYYDEISEGYEELHKEEQLKKIKIIKENITVVNSILDVGCGTGFCLDEFDVRIKVGIDPSEKLTKIGREKGRSVYVGKAEDIDYEDNTYDTVISITAVQNFDDIEMGIKEMKRVAKIQVIISCLKKSPKAKQVEKTIYYLFDDVTNTKEPTAEELIKPEHQDSDSAQDILDNSDKDLLKDSGEDLIQDSDDKVELETYDEDWDNTNKYHKD